MDLKDDESAVDLEVWVENCLDYLLLLSAVVGCPLVMDCCFLDLLLLLLLVEVVLLLLIPYLLPNQLLLLPMIRHMERLDCHYLECCCHCHHLVVPLVGLLLLPLALYAKVSIAMDTYLCLELHRHVALEVEGVVALEVPALAVVELELQVLAVVVVELEVFCLLGLLEVAAVLELPCPMELLLERIPRSVCMPWMVIHLLHCWVAVESH